jgi:predicted TIM-barrel fold metal-dependent hydrolase
MTPPKTSRIIDCDVHCRPFPGATHEDFLPARWRTAVGQRQHTYPGHGYANPFGLDRRDVQCQTPEDFEREHLDRYGIDFAVLQPQPMMDFGLIHAIDVANALCRASNDWLDAVWLQRDPRYLGSVCVNANDPLEAAREIRRAGAIPGMVQVLVPGESTLLYGHRFYHPIYEACEEMGLVFAIHPGAEGSYRSSTPVGRPASYFEWRSGLALTFQAHAASLVIEGVFEKFPGLKVLLTEGGFGWLPQLMWRMDKDFKALRSTVPWLKQEPSAYVKNHVRLTTQPMEEPPSPKHLLAILEMIDAERTLCFSSDFPHWDFDDPVRAFPGAIPQALRERILWDNAAELYGARLPVPAAA